MSNDSHNGMQERLERLAENLISGFSDQACRLERSCGELTLIVPRQHLLEVATRLRDEEAFAFSELIDVCGVDYAAYGCSEWQTETAPNSGFGRGVEAEGELQTTQEERFAAVYHLLSMSHNLRLRLRIYLDTAEPMVDSMVPVWACADWFEREAFDLYGILFSGHPDLRRILTDYGFIGHPFRKDFPLVGQVEMRYDPNQGRVIYEPVVIEPRTLVPRVIRDDNRYLSPDDETQDAGNA